MACGVANMASEAGSPFPHGPLATDVAEARVQACVDFWQACRLPATVAISPAGMDTPNTVIVPDWVFTTRIRFPSRMYTFPDLSTATATAEDSVALSAGPLSPPTPKIPVPAIGARAPVVGFTL